MDEPSYVIDLSLYGGIGGQLLAIATNTAHGDEDWIREMSRRYGTLCLTERCAQVGLLDGLAGRLYVLCVLQEQVGGLKSRITEYVSKNAKSFLQAPRWELSAGSSGALLALGLAAEVAGSMLAEELVELVLLDLLQSSLCSDKSGVMWDIHPYQTAPLLSFAHGAAGICYVLKSIAHSNPSPALFDIVKATFEYEDRTILEHRGMCPDFRVFDKTGYTMGSEYPNQMNAWCHGLPGLFVAREFPYSGTTGDVVVSRAWDALENWRLGNLTLCHGDLGNALIVAAIRGSDYAQDQWLPSCQTELKASIEDILDRVACFERSRWANEMHGLFVGAAGILHANNGLREQKFPDGVLVPLFPKVWPKMPWLRSLHADCVGRNGSVVFLGSDGNIIQIQKILKDRLQHMNGKAVHYSEHEREGSRNYVMVDSGRVEPVSKLLTKATNQVELRRILEEFAVELMSIDVLVELWVVSPLVEVENEEGSLRAVATLGKDGPMRLAGTRLLSRIMSQVPCRGVEISAVVEREEVPGHTRITGSDVIMRLAHAGLIVTGSCSDRLSAMLLRKP